ncbi:unnamed protein product [Penicillium salamii]|nr:unnamed protein product [Penicillium salamii]
MAPALTSTKRPFDPIQDSLTPAAKKLRADPTEPEPKSESDSPTEPSAGLSIHWDTKDTQQDKRRAFTIQFLESFQKVCGDGLLSVPSRCSGGPLAGRYDYRRWAINMEKVLGMNGVAAAVEGKLVADSELSSYPHLRITLARVNALASHIINVNVTESSRSHLRGSKSPQESWQKLRDLYQLSPSELSLEGWSLIKEKKISHYSSACEYTGALQDAWLQVCMDQKDLFKQTQPMLCTALLHGLDGHEWSSWKQTFLTDAQLGADFQKLADKVKSLDPQIRSKSKQRPMLK